MVESNNLDSENIIEHLRKYEIDLDMFLNNPCAEDFGLKGYEERAKYGYAMGDVWNIGFYAMWLIASYCKISKTPPSFSLLNLVIELNEINQQNTFPLGIDEVFEKDVLRPFWLSRALQIQKRVESTWGGMYNEAFERNTKNALLDSQIDYVLQILQTLNRRARVLIERGENTSKLVIWDEYNHLIPDPTCVPVDALEEHQRQRGERGFSDWDAKNPRAHLAWILTQGILFLISEKAMGFSAQVGSFSAWQLELLEFAEGIWADAFINHGLTNDAAPIAIKKMARILPDLWD